MDFVIGLLLSIDWKSDSYDAILDLVDCLTKMVYYEPIKMTLDIANLTKVIINVVIRHHSLSESIFND